MSVINEPILLLVDDDPENLNILNQTLAGHGFKILIANQGKQAIHIINQITPDLMLLDAIMPDFSGFETCKAVKQIQPDLPVIFMTGLSETEHIVAGFDAGGVDYLVKPINHQELLARIKVHLSNAQITKKTKAALDQTGQYLMALDNNGHIIWQTTYAKKLFTSLTTKERQLITIWLSDKETDHSIAIQHDESLFHLTLIERQINNQNLIKITTKNLKTQKQTLKNKLKITRREADVLYWVAQGKTDWEISKILSISDRTVNKHLQQIYRKLNVNNRTAASSQALSIMQNF